MDVTSSCDCLSGKRTRITKIQGRDAASGARILLAPKSTDRFMSQRAEEEPSAGLRM
jgi:hypothetical protein